VKAWCPSEEGELKVQLSSDERPLESKLTRVVVSDYFFNIPWRFHRACMEFCRRVACSCHKAAREFLPHRVTAHGVHPGETHPAAAGFVVELSSSRLSSL